MCLPQPNINTQARHIQGGAPTHHSVDFRRHRIRTVGAAGCSQDDCVSPNLAAFGPGSHNETW